MTGFHPQMPALRCSHCSERTVTPNPGEAEPTCQPQTAPIRAVLAHLAMCSLSIRLGDREWVGCLFVFVIE